MEHLDDPVFSGRLHLVFIVLYALTVPIAFLFGLVYSVAFVSSLSILALALTHWSAREAATAQRDLTKHLDRIEGKVDHLLSLMAGIPTT